MTEKITAATVAQQAELIRAQAAEIGRLKGRCKSRTDALQLMAERFGVQIAALKQQSAGVVLPRAALPADGSYDYCQGHFDALREVVRLNPPGDPTMVKVPRELMRKIHRDLDACQKVIWSGLRGADPAYCADAQECLAAIDDLLAQHEVQS